MKKIILYTMLFGILTFLPGNVHAQTCSPPISGNLTISGDCSFAGTTNGVDEGSGNTNSARITVNSGILTVSSGQTIAFGAIVVTGGAIALPTDGSASLKPGTPLWMSDSDNDLYPASTTQVASVSSPGGSYVRRMGLASVSQADCYDGSSTATYGQTTFYATDRGDGSFDYNCDGQITKARDVCTCSNCAGGCPSAVSCVETVVVEATACGTTGINAGPASCTRTNDIYGTCISCTATGTTTTTMKCR